MAHKNRLLILTCIIAGITVSFMIPSCVDDKYDLKKGISTVFTLGGDSLSIPLGNTDSIKIGDFLKPEDIDMLKVMDNGGYGFTKKDSINEDLSDVLPNDINIEDQTFSENKTVSFGDVNIDDFKIPAISKDTSVSLVSSNISIGNFSVPSVSKSETYSAGMSDYKFNIPTIKDTTVNGGKNDALSDLILPANPGISGVLLTIADMSLPTFSSSNNVNFNFAVPNGVSGINLINLADNNPRPVMEISIELAGASAILNSGVVIPDITINPSDLFVFSTALAGGVIKFDSNTPLNKANGYKQTKSEYIGALNITNEPSGGKLNLSKTMTASGTMSVTGATVMSENLAQINGIDMIVKVSIKNLRISSMDFNIPSIASAISGSVPVNVNTTLPTEVKSVQKVYFNSPPTISFDLKALSLPTMINKTVSIDQLSIHFPDELVFSPALPNNTYTVSNEVLTNPASGKHVTLTLKEMDFSKTSLSSENKLVWNGTVNYTGSVSFNGRINSANIPTAAQDPKMSMDISSALTFKSADVTTNVIQKPFTAFNVGLNISIDISKQVKRLGVINLDPGKKLRINLIKPDLPLSLSANNIIIQFPEMFKFKETLPSNRYVINGTLPDYIELEIEAINVNKDLVDGKLNLKEQVVVSGGMQLNSGTVNSDEFSNFDGKKFGIQASIPDLTISSTSIQLNSISANYSDTTKFDVVFNDFPDEISSIDSVILGNNSNLLISIDLTDVPVLDKPLIGDLTIDFPDLIMFKPGFVDSKNRMVVKKAFSNNKLEISAGIKGLKFDGSQLNGKFTLSEDLGFNVGVSVDEPSINSDDVTNKPVGVAVNVKLTGLQLKKFYGKVDPKVDPITENVDLSSMPDFLKNDDVVLDITKPIISIEANSNLGIPLIATLNLKPYKNGALITGSQQTITLNLPKSPLSTESKKTSFWISPESSGMPAGYTFIPSDIQKLFKTIPDKIELTMNAQADTKEQHFVDLDAKYKLNVKYDVTVPMAFGKELNIVMRDTIKDISESIGKMVAGNKLELIGTFYNSIPLELNVQLIPLDKDNQKINITPANQVINAGAKDGSAVMTNLLISLSDPNSLLKDLKGFEIVFSASSNETIAGTPIKPSNFVKANLKVRLSGGLNTSGLDFGKGDSN